MAPATSAEAVRDETGGLFRSGIVELSLPRRWPPAGQTVWKTRLTQISGGFACALSLDYSMRAHGSPL